MTGTVDADDASVVTSEQVTGIAQEVWESILSTALLPHPLGTDASALEGQAVTGCVHVSGEWTGSVLLSCHLDVATAAAEVMFAADRGSLSSDEISDALGELTNMVGGNVKSLLPVPSRLSVPTVVIGPAGAVRIPGAVLLDRVVLVSAPGPVHISIWKV